MRKCVTAGNKGEGREGKRRGGEERKGGKERDETVKIEKEKKRKCGGKKVMQ